MRRDSARTGSAGFRSYQFVDTRDEVLHHEILFGRRLALVDFLRPLLERQLDAERLVDREGDVEEGQRIDAEIIDRMAFRRNFLTRNIGGVRNDVGNGIKSGRTSRLVLRFSGCGPASARTGRLHGKPRLTVFERFPYTSDPRRATAWTGDTQAVWRIRGFSRTLRHGSTMAPQKSAAGEAP